MKPPPSTSTFTYTFTFLLLSFSLPAAVPMRWTVESSRVQPAQFEAFKGESIALEAALQSYGKPLEIEGEPHLYWQTNGMGAAWWTAPAAVSSNVLSATWTPAMDVGAAAYTCFIGVTGSIYRAAFQLRIRHAPGDVPNELPLPVPTLDFDRVTVLHPPWPSIETVPPIVSNVVTKSYVEALGIKAGAEGAARPLPKYLHALDFADSYPDDAAAYYRSRGNGKADGGCSAVREGGFLARNFDYPLDDRAEFIVRMAAGAGRFASVGVAQVGTNLTEEIVTSGKWSKWYKALPGATVDGINEHGVACNINVVDGDPSWRYGGDIHPLAAVRWVLDNATSAELAASNLAVRIGFPEGWTQNYHYMICDASETYIVEDGNYRQVSNRVALTNFQIVPTREYGAGQERYDALMGGASITNAWYTNAYRRETNPPWVSDLAEVIAYTNEIFDAWATHPKEYFRGKTTNGQPWWQTVHTSVYDISNRTVRIAVQETDDWYTFAVPSAGGVDAETVREIVEPMIESATNATLVAANRYAEESDSVTYSEAVRDASYYTDRVASETIGHAYTNSQMVANNARNQAVVLANNYTDSATNATLAAANAYTDAHAGTGGLSTNAVLALIEDSVGGTNAVRAAVAHTAVGPTWMRPNAWRLTSTPTRDVAEIAAVYYTTNNFRSYSNEVARVITTRSAQLRGERLDRYAVDPLIVTNFAAVTPGCSVDQLGYVTAEADGQYRVSGTDSTGETRYCDIWFSAGIRDTVLNTIYVGDLAPHLAAANDAALDVLANAALVGTYTVSGKTCNQYSTIAPAFAKSGAHGYYNPWAVSPHVLMTAGHMGYLGNRGPITYGGHTVNRVRAVWLKDWALTNGFTEAEVNAVSMIGDIEMIVCDNSGALPAEILPTFISPAAFAARFPGGIRGALLWSANQHHADMVPRVAMNDHGYYLYGDADFAAYPARADLAGRLAAMGQQHIFHGGDSGHVVFLRDDEYDIPITQYYSASTGPDLIAAFPMIKAFVESLGDTLKEVE